MKICKSCKVDKTEKNFSLHRRGSAGRRNTCRSCDTEKVREWRKNNRERSNATARMFYAKNLSRKHATYNVPKTLRGFVDTSVPGFLINRSGVVVNAFKFLKPKIQTHSLGKNGYICVSAGGRKYLHRLLCEAFIPNPENKKTVNHKNGIKTDNRLCNLEWATYSENNMHACKKLKKRIGSDKWNAKLDKNKVVEIFKLLSSGMSERAVGLKFGVCQQAINNVRNKKTWAHINQYL